MKFYTLGILAIALFTFGVNCSSPQTLAPSSTSKAVSIYPNWYVSSGFMADTLSFFGYGTAISADSLTALQKAENQARIILESEIAELTEEIRQTLVDEGSSAATNTDFIIILRTAHSIVEKEARLAQYVVQQEDNRYRGFTLVHISKPELVALLEDGFAGHPRYWGEFSSSKRFASLFE